MKPLAGAPLVLLVPVLLCVPCSLTAATMQDAPPAPPSSANVAVWESGHAEHVYGLPDIQHNRKGTLTLGADALTFTAKSESTSIPRSLVTAVSAGDQRVEMGGTGGKLLRMAIPYGGGAAAATVTHHRVDLLTVEFDDSRGGHHAAVFLLPAKEAEPALGSFAIDSPAHRTVAETVCRSASTEAKSVLVATPNWDQAEVPAVYRALVYEHLIDRLRLTKDVGHVYREGEAISNGECPQYTVHISIATFKEGNAVKRASMGPVGMFVGTTQMKFDVRFTDASGKVNTSEQIKATMRGDSPSMNVADHVAKDIAKHYRRAVQSAEKSSVAQETSGSTL